MSISSPADAWIGFADNLLQSEAFVALRWRGEPPRDFAGLYIDDDDIERALRELPGLRGPAATEAAAIRTKFADELQSWRDSFHLSLKDPTNRFGIICWNARLTEEEAEVFALVCAVELSTARQKLVAYIQDNVALTRLTVGSLRRLFADPHPGPVAVAADSRLQRCGLVQVDDLGPWAQRAVLLPSSVAWILAGDSSLDPELPLGTSVVSAEAATSAEDRLVVVSGGDRTARRELGEATAGGAGYLESDLPSTNAQWEAVVRGATVRGLTVVLELGDDDEIGPMHRGWIERASHLGWVISAPVEPAIETLPGLPWREVTVDMATFPATENGAVLTEAGHRLDKEQARLVELAALALDGDVQAAVRRLASGHLGKLATRIPPARVWDDVVLPPDQLAGLHELVARYRQRDLVYREWGFRASPAAGVVALFAGPSGTGKTMTAEVIAGELGLDLYKIDLSSVVSKYIGETEKNLSVIFEAASAGNAVLFFDEADSLFGKRSEVSDAHDRYANIEVSYLLQRIERHDGLVILATNFQKNIDQAFLRRIHVAVQFPMPEEPERFRIWQATFPPEAPRTEIDFKFLARQFKISGGSIRNAGLHSAFLAADRAEPISMEIVMLGLKREFQKLGRLQTEAEFDRYYDYVKEASSVAAAG